MISIFCRNQYRTALLTKNAARVAKVEGRILEFGGTREELEQEKIWVKAARDLLEQARQFKNRGGSRKAPEYEKLFQKANSLGNPLVPEFEAIFENYNK
ncbi:MAG: hypothetical protein IKX40_08410 [Thermoguttaceae bacterium]|nr:hypothetical protein [Thermoguttaceae bacterium]